MWPVEMEKGLGAEGGVGGGCQGAGLRLRMQFLALSLEAHVTLKEFPQLISLSVKQFNNQSI